MTTPVLTAHITHLVVVVAVPTDDNHNRTPGVREYIVETYVVDPTRLDFTDVVRERIQVHPTAAATESMMFSAARNRVTPAVTENNQTIAWRSVESLTDTRRLTQPDLGGQRAAEARLVHELTGGVADLEGLPARSVPCIGLVNLTYTKAYR